MKNASPEEQGTVTPLLSRPPEPLATTATQHPVAAIAHGWMARTAVTLK
jgi:hypothetical protein